MLISIPLHDRQVNLHSYHLPHSKVVLSAVHYIQYINAICEINVHNFTNSQ